MDNITVKSSGNTIKLQSTAEEVTGGYLDSQEVWHEFGGGSSAKRKFKLKSRVGQTALTQVKYVCLPFTFKGATVTGGNDTMIGVSFQIFNNSFRVRMNQVPLTTTPGPYTSPFGLDLITTEGNVSTSYTDTVFTLLDDTFFDTYEEYLNLFMEEI